MNVLRLGDWFLRPCRSPRRPRRRNALRRQGQHLGVVNCASSLCHGSVQPWKDGQRPAERVRHLVARRQARMRASYEMLLNERSQQAHRGATSASTQPAHEATDLPRLPRAQRAGRRSAASASGSPTASSCEACHGPAEGWIKSARRARTRRTSENVAQRAVSRRADPRGARQLCACRATSATRTSSSPTASWARAIRA